MKAKWFEVVWRIDLTAPTHEDAARQALEVQRDTNSIATNFEVRRKKRRARRRFIDADPNL